MLRSKDLPSAGYWTNEITRYVVLRSRDLPSVGHWTNKIASIAVFRSRDLPSAGHCTNDIVPIVMLRSRDLPSVRQWTNNILCCSAPRHIYCIDLFFLCTGLGFECGLYVKALKDSCISEDQNKLEIGDYVMKVR